MRETRECEQKRKKFNQLLYTCWTWILVCMTRPRRRAFLLWCCGFRGKTQNNAQDQSPRVFSRVDDVKNHCCGVWRLLSWWWRRWRARVRPKVINEQHKTWAANHYEFMKLIIMTLNDCHSHARTVHTSIIHTTASKHRANFSVSLSSRSSGFCLFAHFLLLIFAFFHIHIKLLLAWFVLVYGKYTSRCIFLCGYACNKQ